MWDSMARARSALPFIGSLGKHLPTIAATLNDAGHDGEAARRPTARLPLLRLPRLESELKLDINRLARRGYVLGDSGVLGDTGHRAAPKKCPSNKLYQGL